MSKTKAKAQLAKNKKNDAILKKHVETAKAEREAAEDLNRHKSMLDKKVFVMQDNKICSGIVTEVRTSFTNDTKLIHYLVADENNRQNVFKFFHKDCFTSIPALFRDLKQSYADYLKEFPANAEYKMATN